MSEHLTDVPIFIEFDVCEPADRMMLDLEHHAYALGQRLREPGIWNVACEWLEIAAGLGAVEVDLRSFDSSLFSCGPATRYFNTRSAVAGLIVTEIARFFFLWGALEGYIGEIPRGRPKIPILRKMLQQYQTSRPRPAHFGCTASNLQHFIGVSESYRHLAQHFTAPGYDTHADIVIAAIAKLRNGLVHGNLTIPESLPYGGHPRTDVSVIRCAGRIVLFVIQMLSAADAFRTGEIAEQRDYADEYIESQLFEILNEVHLEPIEYDYNILLPFGAA